jgi:hypothetical protein
MLAWRPPLHTDVLDLGHGLGSSDSLRRATKLRVTRGTAPRDEPGSTRRRGGDLGRCVLHRPRAGRRGHRPHRVVCEPAGSPIVLSVDAKSKIRAQDRTAPIPPLQPGLAERRSTTTSGTGP